MMPLLLRVLVCAFVLTMGLAGQTIDGNLVGTVTDASGAVIGGADVTLENKAVGLKQTTKTTESGTYRFGNLPVGLYDVTVTKPGFATATTKNVAIDLNKTVTQNLRLEVGQASTSVVVEEAIAQIDTTTAQVTNNFEARQARDLPTMSVGTLGALNLSLLSAGVSSSGGVGYGTGPSIGGQRPTNNNFTVEGVDNNDKSVTGPVVVIPNEATLSQSVLQNQYSAEFGHSSGGVFNTVVKSGTNQFHGSIYNYHENRKWNAIDASIARSGVTENPRYDRNRLGATAGGAIIKDRLFYFGNFEYIPLGQAGATSADLLAPTADGMTRLSSIPGISATNLGVFRQYVPPAPRASGSVSVGGVSIPVGSLVVDRPSFSNTYNWLTAMDYNISDRDQLRGRFVMNKSSAIDTAASLPIFFSTVPSTAYLATATHFHTFTPSLTNELRFSYNRQNGSFPVGPERFPGLDSFPNLGFDDLNGLNIGPNGNFPQTGIQNTYQLSNNLAWIKGRHTFKVGYDGRKVIAPSFFVQRSRGDYYYNTFEGYLFDRGPEFGQRSAGATPFNGDLMSHYLFANDDWKVSRKLTINFGIRAEHVGVPVGNTLQRLNAVASVPGFIEFGAPKAERINWAPRLGLAYSLRDDLVVRTGFGMAYDQVYQNLGTLSLPPQLALTNDVAGDGRETNFLRNGGLSGAAPAGGFTPAEARRNTAAFVPDQRRPYSINWNFGVQKVFRKDYTLEVRYLGTRGLRLPVQNRLNNRENTAPDRQVPTFLQRPSQAEIDALPLTVSQLNIGRFVPEWAAAGFNGANVVAFMPWGQSTYHGLATQLNRRFANGLLFTAAHTWSKNIDDSTAALFSTVLAPRRPQAFRDLKNERSVSPLDRRHRFTGSVIYDTPWLNKSGNWFAKNIIGNWTVSAIYTAESGMPATVQSGVDSNLNGDNAGDRAIVNASGNATQGSGITALCRSNRPSNIACNVGLAAAYPFVVGYVANNPSARYIQAGPGTFPNAGRNTLLMPGINNWDIGLQKNFNIGERMKFNINATMWNALNHSQFIPGSPNTVRSVSRTDTRAYLQPQLPAFLNAASAFGNNARNILLLGRLTW